MHTYIPTIEPVQHDPRHVQQHYNNMTLIHETYMTWHLDKKLIETCHFIFILTKNMDN